MQETILSENQRKMDRDVDAFSANLLTKGVGLHRIVLCRAKAPIVRTRQLNAILSQRKDKMMAHKIACLAFLGLILTVTAAAAGQSEKERAAVVSAERWLGLVDGEKYAESWKEAAELFRNAIRQEQWEQSLQAVRKPLGKLVTRKLKATTYKTSLPGAPDGDYVVIEFTTSFENKKSAVETVTPMMDKDGKWRVSGYYIK